MINIIAPTHVRAMHYATGLGIGPKDYRVGTSPASVFRLTGDFHILPGTSPEVAALAHHAAARSSDGTVIDHAGGH